MVTGCDKECLRGQRQNRIAECSWLFPLLKLSWLIPKTRREREGNKAIWAAIAESTLSWCLRALKPREVTTEPLKGSSDAAFLRALLCRSTGSIFYLLSSSKNLKIPSVETLGLLPITFTHCPSTLCTGWGEQRSCNTEHPGDQTTETSAKIPKGHILIGLNNVSNRI